MGIAIRGERRIFLWEKINHGGGMGILLVFYFAVG